MLAGSDLRHIGGSARVLPNHPPHSRWYRPADV